MNEELTSEDVAGLIWDVARFAAQRGQEGVPPVQVANDALARWELAHASVTADQQ